MGLNLRSMAFLGGGISALSACLLACQKRAADPIVDGCASLGGSWEMNSGPLEGQPTVLLTPEPSLQTQLGGF